jgi:hypothetical protein
MKPILTIEDLCAEATSFSEIESIYDEPTLYGVTDGKAVGTYLEQKFTAYLTVKYTHQPGNNDYRKLVLITQKSVGDDTSIIQDKAPKTWQYLLTYDEYLSARKSSIYKNKPPYSIFGVGSYSFKNWKIAISGLYKRLKFYLISPLDGKSVMFDDTVNFLSFETEEEAKFIFGLITSNPSMEFLDSMIFWDEKRPITIDILKRLSLKAVAKELRVLESYMQWSQGVYIASK